jgi:Predicted redox protein, regulator of disulfide bond formation
MPTVSDDRLKDVARPPQFAVPDIQAMQALADQIRADPACGMATFRAKTTWENRFRSRSRVTSQSLDGSVRNCDFTIASDAPREFGGSDSAPNPLELLLAAVNACLICGYVLDAMFQDITIESLEVETSGELDLRGLLGVCEDVRPGYESIFYVVRVKGNATQEAFQQMHCRVQARSPVCFSLTRPTLLNGRIEVIG